MRTLTGVFDSPDVQLTAPRVPVVTDVLLFGLWKTTFLDHLNQKGLGLPKVAKQGYRLSVGERREEAMPRLGRHGLGRVRP